MKSLRLWLVLICAGMVFGNLVGVPASAQQTTATYDSLIEEITQLLTDGKVAEASEKALKATTLAPNRYEGFLYLGIAKFYQDAYDEAELSLKKALGLAPEDQKKPVADALDKLAATRKFGLLLAAAEQSETEGLRPKAAREYTEAWRLFPAREDLAKKAILLWESINELFESARVRNAIYPEARENDERAADELFRAWSQNFLWFTDKGDGIEAQCNERFKAVLQLVADRKLKEALAVCTPIAEARRVRYNTAVYQNRINGWRYRSAQGALCYLLGDKKAAFASWKALAGVHTPEQPLQFSLRSGVLSSDEMARLQSDPEFQTFVEDAFGPTAKNFILNEKP